MSLCTPSPPAGRPRWRAEAGPERRGRAKRPAGCTAGQRCHIPPSRCPAAAPRGRLSPPPHPPPSSSPAGATGPCEEPRDRVEPLAPPHSQPPCLVSCCARFPVPTRPMGRQCQRPRPERAYAPPFAVTGRLTCVERVRYHSPARPPFMAAFPTCRSAQGDGMEWRGSVMTAQELRGICTALGPCVFAPAGSTLRRCRPCWIRPAPVGNEEPAS